MFKFHASVSGEIPVYINNLQKEVPNKRPERMYLEKEAFESIPATHKWRR